MHHLRNDVGLQNEEQMAIKTEMNGRNLAVVFGSTQNRRKWGLPLFLQFYRWGGKRTDTYIKWDAEKFLRCKHFSSSLSM